MWQQIWDKIKRGGGHYQCVVEANVSFQAGANMVELHNGYFCSCDGQDVLHTFGKDVETSGTLIVCFIQF